MAIISEESKQATVISSMFTPEKFNMNGKWDLLHHSSFTYHIALMYVIKEFKRDPHAFLRIEALERTSEGIHIWYDNYF